MNCAGCGREMEDGDLCIKGTAGAIMGHKTDPDVDSLMASLFGGVDELILCLDCTERGGVFTVEVYHGAERGGEDN